MICWKANLCPITSKSLSNHNLPKSKSLSNHS